MSVIVRDGPGGATDPWYYDLGRDAWLTDAHHASVFHTRQQASRVLMGRGLSIKFTRVVEMEPDDGTTKNTGRRNKGDGRR